MKTEITDRLASLRAAMEAAAVDATVIPKTDPHQSEYLADHWQAVRWLSGFTGSAGTLVVTADKALFWTDSRYFIQAADQLEGTTIELMKDGLPETPTIEAFLCDTLATGATVGIDGMVFSKAATDRLASSLGAAGIGLDVSFAPLGSIWTDRPPLPQAPVFIHALEYAGEPASSKIAKVLAETRLQEATSVFISDLAEVAWTLNVRSADVECNPVVMAFLYLDAEGSTLFVDPAKIDAATAGYLADCGVAVAPYSAVKDTLAAIPATARVLLSPAQTAGAFFAILGDRAVEGTSPVAMLKSCKNAVQTAGIRRAMERDGVALVKSFMEIERRLDTPDGVTEMEVADILLRHRSRQPLFYQPSFETICGYGPHGAIVHYAATEATDVRIGRDSLLLIDSGGNYLDGTTDITRTVCYGTPTDRQRRDFTLVMKGVIALASAVYPVGTRGGQLDVLARQFMWKDGLTYLHGTGHGVGHFLNVHEGPQTIRLNDTPAPLCEGMVTSDEPGIYRAGLWGIRCENLLLTVPAPAVEEGDGVTRFLTFETLTLFPFDRGLFDLSIMTPDEIDWVDSYHRAVFERLSPALEPDETRWLARATAPLEKPD